MQYALVNDKNKIEGLFDRKIIVDNTKRLIEVENPDSSLIGKSVGVKDSSKMKIAFICNWKTPCGISTYTQYLIDSLRPKVADIRIFSEIEARANTDLDEQENVVRCWKRGDSMLSTIQLIKDWKPDFVIIQHEFGIFPKATHFLKLIQSLDSIPHAIVMHSVYGNHYDKTICTSAIKNMIVHSNEAKDTLEQLGHTTNYIQVIPHGCVSYQNIQENWNIFQTPYALVQFGFGFFYKGVDRAIKAIGHLKTKYPEKYKDIFYCYLCSESANATGTHAQYQEYLEKLIQELDLEDNVVIIRKFHSQEIINTYLRTAKLALFPYVTDPKNIVFGASGAIRVAMANEIPVIASESHMFDDLNGVIPRPASDLELAEEIDRIFSNSNYKTTLLAKNQEYVRNNSWDIITDQYLSAIRNILDKENIVEIESK